MRILAVAEEEGADHGDTVLVVVLEVAEVGVAAAAAAAGESRNRRAIICEAISVSEGTERFICMYRGVWGAFIFSRHGLLLFGEAQG
jgi:hypothetical protein